MTRFSVALAFLLASLWSAPATAIKVFDLGASAYIVPTWFIYAGSPANGVVITQDGGDATNFEVQVGAANFGAFQNDSQTQGIYGAGALLPDNNGNGYRIEFTTDIHGWDSYSVTPAPGSLGYSDLFAVNVNQSKYYWNQVDGSAGALTDPLISPDPAGDCTITAGGGGDPCQAATGSSLSGQIWAWGATDYANGTFESNAGSYTLTLAGQDGSDYFLSAVLDTATTPDADDNYPSFGSFNPLSSVPPPQIPEPGAPWLLGSALGGVALAARRKHSTSR